MTLPSTSSATSNAGATAPAPFPPPYYGPTEPRHRSDGVRHYAGITYAAIGGYRPLLLDLWVPEARGTSVPLVIWIHGGAWMVGDRRHLPPTFRPGSVFEAFLKAGLAVATIDYRHAAEAPYPAQLHDAKAAVRYLRAFSAQLGIDADRIGVCGESAGGHLASLLALSGRRPDLEGTTGVVGPSSSVSAAAIWYGVADLATMPPLDPPDEAAAVAPPELLADPLVLLLRGIDEAARRDASPITLVHPAAPPFLLVHGDSDQLVPLQQSQLLHTGLQAAGVDSTLLVVPGADHIFLGCEDVDGVVNATVDYLQANLSGPESAEGSPA